MPTTNPPTTLNHHSAGSALVIVLLMVAVTGIMGAILLSVSVTESRIAANEVVSGRAFNVAEAGIEHAKIDLIGQTADGVLAAPVILNKTSFGNGTYTVTVSNNVAPGFPRNGIPADAGGATDDTDGWLVLTSEGEHSGGRRAIEVIFSVTEAAGGGIFEYTAFGNTRMEWTNGTVIGSVFGNVTVKNKTLIGDATSAVTVNDHSLVTGTITEGAAPLSFPMLPCPVLPWGPAPVGPSVSLDGAGKLSMSGGGDTTFAGGTYMFSEVSKSGGGRIIVPAGQSVDIWLTGKFSASGGGWLNPAGTAADFQIWTCGTNSGDISFSGDTLSKVTVYAPLSKVGITGPGDKTGAFIGKEWKNTGSAIIAYDPALAGSAGIDSVTGVTGTWTERPF